MNLHPNRGSSRRTRLEGKPGRVAPRGSFVAQREREVDGSGWGRNLGIDPVDESGGLPSFNFHGDDSFQVDYATDFNRVKAFQTIFRGGGGGPKPPILPARGSDLHPCEGVDVAHLDGEDFGAIPIEDRRALARREHRQVVLPAHFGPIDHVGRAGRLGNAIDGNAQVLRALMGDQPRVDGPLAPCERLHLAAFPGGDRQLDAGKVAELDSGTDDHGGALGEAAALMGSGWFGRGGVLDPHELALAGAQGIDHAGGRCGRLKHGGDPLACVSRSRRSTYIHTIHRIRAESSTGTDIPARSCVS